MEISVIVYIALVIGSYIYVTHNFIFKCKYSSLILSGVKMAFLPTSNNNARILNKTRNRSVTLFSIKLGDICNVE